MYDYKIAVIRQCHYCDYIGPNVHYETGSVGGRDNVEVGRCNDHIACAIRRNLKLGMTQERAEFWARQVTR